MMDRRTEPQDNWQATSSLLEDSSSSSPGMHSSSTSPLRIVDGHDSSAQQQQFVSVLSSQQQEHEQPPKKEELPLLEYPNTLMDAPIAPLKHAAPTSMEGCQEIFVGGGWGGVYSFYRRVLDGMVHNQTASQYCLMVEGERLGGRTYSVTVPRRYTSSDQFVVEVGQDGQFSSNLRLTHDLITQQLQLTTACVHPDCATPTWSDFNPLLGYAKEEGGRQRLAWFLQTTNSTQLTPFRRIVDATTGVPLGMETALDQMVETCRLLGARVFDHTKLVQLHVIRQPSTPQKTVELVFEHAKTGHQTTVTSSSSSASPSGLATKQKDLKKNAQVVVLNLPRSDLFQIQGVEKALLNPRTANILKCHVDDPPSAVVGRDRAVQLWHQHQQQFHATAGKAYLYYPQAWWKTASFSSLLSSSNRTTTTWPLQTNTDWDTTALWGGAIQTRQGVLLKVNWHNGPVACSGNDNDQHCHGFLEIFSSPSSNETFYSSLPAATLWETDDDNNKKKKDKVDPLGMVWVQDSPHAKQELGWIHEALMESLAPLVGTTEWSQEVEPPVGLVVGIWQQPADHDDDYKNNNKGWTNPTKVIYDPSLSGTLDQACGVPGLTPESYQRTALQPFGLSNGDVDGQFLFLINNDFVSTQAQEYYGDWAEESLIQAERAMHIMGMSFPAWLQTDYNLSPRHHSHGTTIVSTTPSSEGMSDIVTLLLVLSVIVSLMAFVMEVTRRREPLVVDVPKKLPGKDDAVKTTDDDDDDDADKVIVMSSAAHKKGLTSGHGTAISYFGEVDETDLNTEFNAGSKDGGTEEDVDSGSSTEDHSHRLNLFQLHNIAIPVSYCVCGTTGGMFRTFMNVYPLDIGANEAQQTTFMTLAALPATFKILYGFTSDTNPLFGYRRKPYLFLGWLTASAGMWWLLMTSDLSLQREEQTILEIDENGVEHEETHQVVIVPENAPSLFRLCCCFFLYGFGMWFANAMADALVAEKAKFEPEAVRGSLQSTCYLMRFFGLMVAAPVSTYLYSKVGPQVIVQCIAVIPCFVLPLTWWLAEVQVAVRPVKEQCMEIWRTVCSRSVWEPMAFLYLFNVLQVSNAAWRQFLVTVLGFSPANLNTLLVVSYVLVYLGTTLYKYCLLHTSWRLIYQCCLVLNLIFSSLQLLLIRGHTFGISPFLFALGDDAFAEFLNGIQFLPAVVMMVSLCPTGSEGVSYAMFTTVMHSSHQISNAISSLLLAIWDVSKETLSRGELDGMFNLSLLTTAIQFSPLLFLHWLPHGRKELEELSLRPFSGSAIGGGVFLSVLFGSMTLTVFVSVMNIARPGWAGES